jgi:hypothetical protein
MKNPKKVNDVNGLGKDPGNVMVQSAARPGPTRSCVGRAGPFGTPQVRDATFAGRSAETDREASEGETPYLYNSGCCDFWSFLFCCHI